LIEERAVEIYNRLRDELRRDFERLVDEYLGRSNVDERTVKSIARAVAGQEFARLHGIVMEEISRLKSEVEELGRQGVDAELIRRMIDEVYGKLLDDIKQIIDQRIMHLVDTMNEVSNVNKDVLDLVNEILKAEVEFREEFERLRGLLDEEHLEELLYRVLIRRGIIRRRHRKWILPIAGLVVLGAIIAGLIINPILTIVIIAIAIVILLRW
jgi:DNA polymerase III gamma/tau subunit